MTGPLIKMGCYKWYQSMYSARNMPVLDPKGIDYGNQCGWVQEAPKAISEHLALGLKKKNL